MRLRIASSRMLDEKLNSKNISNLGMKNGISSFLCMSYCVKLLESET